MMSPFWWFHLSIFVNNSPHLNDVNVLFFVLLVPASIKKARATVRIASTSYSNSNDNLDDSHANGIAVWRIKYEKKN